MNRAMIESLESRELLSATLTGSFMGKVPSALPPVGSTRITMRLTNSGDARLSAAADVNVYASSTPTLAADATLLTSSSRNLRLRPGQATTINLKLASPAGVPDGNYYLVETVDAPNAALPQAVVNSPQSLSIAQPYVDLTGTIIAQPRTSFVSNLVAGRGQARIRVVNQGNARAQGPMQITVYASSTGALDSNAVPVGVAVVRNINIKAGGSRAVVAQILVPPGTAVGNYTILAAINSANTVQERDTSNNLVGSPQTMAVLNAPTFVNVPHHGGNNNSGGIFVGGGGAYIDVIDYGDGSGGYYDPGTSDGDSSAPPSDTGTTYSDPGTTTAPVDNSPPSDSGDSSDSGSDFGSDPGDPGGGADF